MSSFYWGTPGDVFLEDSMTSHCSLVASPHLKFTGRTFFWWLPSQSVIFQASHHLKVTGGTFFLVVAMPISDFPDFWRITGNCLYLFSWPLVVMSSVAMVTSYFPYVGGVCHTTSIFWRGVSGGSLYCIW